MESRVAGFFPPAPMIPLFRPRGHSRCGTTGLTPACAGLIIGPSEIKGPVDMRLKKIFLFTLGLLAVLAAFLSARKLRK
jgi:hypothetical protein